MRGIRPAILASAVMVAMSPVSLIAWVVVHPSLAWAALLGGVFGVLGVLALERLWRRRRRRSSSAGRRA